VTALKLGPFSDSQCKKPTNNLDKLRQRAAKFMQLEEMREFKTKFTDGAENRRAKREAPKGMRALRRPKEFPKPSRFLHYTSFTIERSQILEKALNADLIPP